MALPHQQQYSEPDAFASLLPAGVDAALVEAAWTRAVAAEPEGDADSSATARTQIFAADLLSGLVLERPWKRADAEDLVAEVARTEGRLPHRTALAIYLRAARDPRLLQLPPRLGAEAQLRLLIALAPVREASLWKTTATGRPECIAHIGDAAPTRRVHAVARAVLENRCEDVYTERGTIHGVAVRRWGSPFAALVVRASAEDRPRWTPFVDEAAAVLAPVLEKEALLANNAARERVLIESSEKRLMRLGFDLHDGPMQEVLLLASDVRLLRDQLGQVLGGDARRELMLGRLDDLDARLHALDGELRGLSHSLEPASVFKRPLRSLLETELEAFAARTNACTTLDADGDLEQLTAPEKDVLRRVVQEALANVREHSGAKNVRVAIKLGRKELVAQIADDGRGFDVERTLVRASERGRLGLVGMSERARLLGGTLRLESRPGGPTSVTLVLPRWRAASFEQAAEEAA